MKESGGWGRGGGGRRSLPGPSGRHPKGAAPGTSRGRIGVTHGAPRRSRWTRGGPKRPPQPGPPAQRWRQPGSGRPGELPQRLRPRPPPQRGSEAARRHPPAAAPAGAAVARKRALVGGEKACRRLAGALRPPAQWQRAATAKGGGRTAEGRGVPIPAELAGLGSRGRRRWRPRGYMGAPRGRARGPRGAAASHPPRHRERWARPRWTT